MLTRCTRCRSSILLVLAWSGLVVLGAPALAQKVTYFHYDPSGSRVLATDANGRYTLAVDFGGTLQVRARAPYFKDTTQTLQLATDATASANFALTRHSVPGKSNNHLSQDSRRLPGLTGWDWKSDPGAGR